MFKKILYIIFVFLFCSAGLADDADSPLKFQIETDKKSYVAGEEIIVHGKIINTSDKEIVFYKNGKLNDISVRIKPLENETLSPMAGGVQTMEYYNPQSITLSPSKPLEVTAVLKLSNGPKRFNYKCVEEEELAPPYIKVPNKICVKETFDEGERFVIQSAEARSWDGDMVLALNDGKYQVQATYDTDSSSKNFWSVFEGKVEEDKETPQNLTHGKTLQSNIVEITLSK